MGDFFDLPESGLGAADISDESSQKQTDNPYGKSLFFQLKLALSRFKQGQLRFAAKKSSNRSHRVSRRKALRSWGRLARVATLQVLSIADFGLGRNNDPFCNEGCRL